MANIMDGAITGLEAIAPETGYVVTRSILSNRASVLFAVYDPAWSELSESEEWKAFEDLLERTQREYDQTRRLIEGCRRGSSNCK